jgi:hypothetical protein
MGWIKPLTISRYCPFKGMLPMINEGGRKDDKCSEYAWDRGDGCPFAFLFAALYCTFCQKTSVASVQSYINNLFTFIIL